MGFLVTTLKNLNHAIFGSRLRHLLLKMVLKFIPTIFNYTMILKWQKVVVRGGPDNFKSNFLKIFGPALRGTTTIAMVLTLSQHLIESEASVKIFSDAFPVVALSFSLTFSSALYPLVEAGPAFFDDAGPTLGFDLGSTLSNFPRKSPKVSLDLGVDLAAGCSGAV